MTGPTAMAAASGDAVLATSAYDLPPQQLVRYTYWPVNYFLGDPTVISAAPLPLSGVKFSQVMKGTGELRASLQLADPDVRAMNPWELIIPRKTGIVVVRSTMFPGDESEVHQAMWHGVVWAAPTNDSTGRMEITARTIEYNWAQRLITGPMSGGDLVFAQKDRTTIVQDLLTPERFSQVGPATNLGVAEASFDASTTTFVTPTAEAANITTGGYVTIVDVTGVRRTTTSGFPAFRVIAQSAPSGGQVTITFTPASSSATRIDDVMTGIALFPGWVNVDKPTRMTGQVHDLTYKRDQQTNLLEAHQDRSKVGDGYDWYTSVRPLSGTDAYNATSYRVQFVMGYPRLGREYGVDDIPRFTFYVDGRGNVATAGATQYDGSGVRNVMWGAGAGFDEATVRALATNSSDWASGFMITEGRYSNPDVSVAATLEAYTAAALIQSYANEQFIQSVVVRGDLPPYLNTYTLGDDALYTTDGWGNRDQVDGTRDVTYTTRIMGWTVTPPEGANNETVELLLAGGSLGSNDG